MRRKKTGVPNPGTPVFLATTADKFIVMSHNPILAPEVTVDKNGNRIEAGKYDIRKMTVKEIKQFNVAAMDKNTEYYKLHGTSQVNPKKAQISTLEELFQLIQKSGNKDVKLNIETKSYPDPLQQAEHANNADSVKFLNRFNELVKKYNMEDRVVLQSFDWETLRLEKQMNPNISLSALIEEEPSWGKAAESLRPFDAEKSPWLGGLDIKDFKGDAMKAAKAIGADIVSPYYGEINKNMVDEAHELGMKVVPWTVNSVSDMEIMYDMGFDGAGFAHENPLFDKITSRPPKVKKGRMTRWTRNRMLPLTGWGMLLIMTDYFSYMNVWTRQNFPKSHITPRSMNSTSY